MKKKSVIWNLVLIVVFGGLGLTQFSEGVRTVQILGLFTAGMIVGGSITTIVNALKPADDKK
jgi:hypothetical protein